MEQLAHNSLIKIIGEEKDTLYRVILDEPKLAKTALVAFVERTTGPITPSIRGGRRHKTTSRVPRKKSPLPLMGAVTWFDREEIEQLEQQRLLLRVDIDLETGYFKAPQGERQKREFKRRCEVAAPFLDLPHLREEVLASQGFASLIAETCQKGCSKALAYKVLSLLCRFGFHERSLHDRRFGCGAPGKPKRCDAGGRKKAGRKTDNERLARLHGLEHPPQQPGISEEWVTKIKAADDELSKLKMKMPERIDRILSSAFVAQFKFVDGVPVEVDMPKGSYPNRRQIERVLRREIPKLVALQQKTTTGHFNRNLRGLRARSWKQIPGPGHTWCIDSTVGDIYLRSTVDRTWIVGRPVVYIVVDVWSTAVVGFHVCLQHPSWRVAKVALFNSVAPMELLGEIYGCSVTLALDPLPTLPASLWMDNGEYRSKGGRSFGMHVPDESFTPPYRPDWHGVVEVLHRIGKENIQAIPGAIDYRRQELELRQYRPRRAVMTLPEFVHYLYVVFWRYNLSANRDYRLDTTMKACGVQSSPAGLWRFGHSMGIGTQRAFPLPTLIADLLPSEGARVTRNGVYRAKLDYGWPGELEEEWSTSARFRGWDIQAHYHPGGLSKIWTPDTYASRMLDLTLRDTAIAPKSATVFDYLDQQVYWTLKRGDNEHLCNLIRVLAAKQLKVQRDNAVELTREAEAAARGARPTITEAREMENSFFQAPEIPRPHDDASLRESLGDDGLEDHLRFMAHLSEEFNREMDHE